MARKSGRKKTPGRPGKSQTDLLPQGYEEFVRQLKERIQAARVRAALAVNRELVVLYWEIGRDILARQAEHGWGSKVVDRLAVDLQKAFPGVEGFSPRNLKYMRAFAAAWPDEPIVQEALAQITWYQFRAMWRFLLSDLVPCLPALKDKPPVFKRGNSHELRFRLYPFQTKRFISCIKKFVEKLESRVT